MQQEDGSYRIQLHGYNLVTGVQEVSSNLGQVETKGPLTLIGDRSTLYTTLDRKVVNAIEAEKGRVIWKSTPFENIGPMEVRGDLVIFIMTSIQTKERLIVALNSKTGQVMWQQPLV